MIPRSDLEVKERFAEKANQARGLSRFRSPGSEKLVSVGENDLLHLSYVRNFNAHEVYDVLEINGTWLQYYLDTAETNDLFGMMIVHLDETLSKIEYNSGGIVVFDEGFDVRYPNGRPKERRLNIPKYADLRWVMDTEEWIIRPRQ